MGNAPKDICIREFPNLSAIDTCSVWNVLCSKTLLVGARTGQCCFILTEFVRYECLDKKRTSPSAREMKLQDELKSELDAGNMFNVASVDVNDLRELISNIGQINHFHRGELATLALSRKLRCGFITDDRRARRVGEKAVGSEFVRTTPHLVGWLIYSFFLSDIDIPQIISDNQEYRQKYGNLGEYIQECYEHAMGLRLRDKSSF